MARPPKRKVVEGEPPSDYFKPRGIPLVHLEENSLTIEELEALRLADKEGCYQEEAAEQMGVSRQTFQRILKQARQKVTDALVNGKAVHISGGKYVTPMGVGVSGAGIAAERLNPQREGGGRPGAVPSATYPPSKAVGSAPHTPHLLACANLLWDVGG